MSTGTFELKEQYGQRGYFGCVSLHTEPRDDGQFQVEFDPVAATRWRSAAQFGIDYFFEHIPKKKLFPNGLRVVVSSIVGHEVDTTNPVIAYVAFGALDDALKGQVDIKKRPVLNVAGGTIEFPK